MAVASENRDQTTHGSSVQVRLLCTFVGTAVVAGVVAAGIAMPAVGGVSAVAKTAIESFESLPEKLGQPVLPQRSTVQDSGGKTLAYFWEENRVIVPLKKVAPVLLKAVIAIEDSRFYEHNGVDVRGTLRALATNQQSGEVVQGGSTITQQYVKLVLLNNAKTDAEKMAATERTAERKLREARYAIALENEVSKDAILDGYLNAAYYGAGAYGVEVAAQTYFRTSAKELDLVEAATLAGIIQQPAAFDPIRNPKASTARRNQVLLRMLELGDITSAQYTKAKKTPLKKYLTPKILKNGCTKAYASYFCDYTLNYIRNTPTFGKTKKARINFLQTGGLEIVTTLDRGDQGASQRTVENYIPIGDPSHKAAAISMVQPRTGKILAMAQNTKWGTKGNGKTTYNYNVRRADGGTIGMQSGSSFKPFTLAAALEKGISPSISINAPGVKTFYGFRDCDGYQFPGYTVRNASVSEAGNFDMYSGTKHSVNTFFVGLEQMVSLCRQAEIAESLGVRRGDGKQLNRVPSFVLGANEVVPLDMAGAFAGFANDGVWCKPNPIDKIVGIEDGHKIYNASPDCHRVLSSAVAQTVTSLLKGPLGAGGTASGQTFGRPAAGKTGTSDSSSAVWFAGYTPQISSAVWVGDPRGGYRYPLRNVVINGRYYGTVYGGSLPAPIWRAAMAAAHSGLPIQDFGSAPSYYDSSGVDSGPPEQQSPSNPKPDKGTDWGRELLDRLPDFDFGR